MTAASLMITSGVLICRCEGRDVDVDGGMNE